MVIYILKRLIQAVVTLFIISVLTFGISRALPGDPLASYFDTSVTRGMSPDEVKEYREELREMHGLDDSYVDQYISWLDTTFVERDLGYSLSKKRPSSQVIGEALKNTIYLGGATFIFTFIVSVPLGIIAAVKKGTIIDDFIKIFTILGISLPSFVIGILLIYIFAGILGVLPFSGMTEVGLNPEDGLEFYLSLGKHMVLPMLTLGIPSIAYQVRYVRNAMLDCLSQDYIRTARSKGVSGSKIVMSHAFRNALGTVATLVVLSLPTVFNSGIITESIFGWPGLGSELLSAVTSRDNAIMLNIVMFYAFIAVMATILADIVLAIVDPRVKLR